MQYIKVFLKPFVSVRTMGGMIRPMSACSLSVWSEIISGLVTSSRHMLWERGVKMKLSFLLFSNPLGAKGIFIY